VAVLDRKGNGELYLRDIELQQKDWFYVGMADVTLTSNDSNGPIELLQGENNDYDFDSSATRGSRSSSTASSTRTGAHGERRHARCGRSTSCSATSSTSRRVAVPPHRSGLSLPDVRRRRHGRGSAPTLGKFYVKVGRDDSYGEWGNFHIGYMNNELAQVDRGLYGAEPALRVAARDELRRTALRDRRLHGGAGHDREPRGIPRHGRLAVLLAASGLADGSERVRIEYRDRARGSSRAS
jgi:hypothetical protein